MNGNAALTVRDVARFLKVAPQKVNELIASQEIPAFRVGSSVRVLYSDLLEYVHARKTIFSAKSRNLANENDSLFVVNSLSMRTGNFRLENISFELPRGKIMALLGPSGSGKTLLLRAIAGLHPLDAGTVYLGTRRLDLLTPQERGVGFVYQDYALFPNLRSRENIAFPVFASTHRRELVDIEVARVIEELQIDDMFLRRFPHQLPEGVKQLVAIGREKIHVIELFLMDEPLTHLDAHVRSSMRAFIKQIVTGLGKTTIIAVNSPEDALALSDYTGIIHRGRIIQFGPTRMLYAHPHSSMAMDALSPLGVNYLLVDVTGGLTEPYGMRATVPDGIYVLAFRPEEVRVSGEGIALTIRDSVFYDGTRVVCSASTPDGGEVRVVLPSSADSAKAVPSGSTVTVLPTAPVYFS